MRIVPEFQISQFANWPDASLLIERPLTNDSPGRLDRNTVNRYWEAIGACIAQFCEVHSPFGGEVEVDESSLRARRIKGETGTGVNTIKFPNDVSLCSCKNMHGDLTMVRLSN